MLEETSQSEEASEETRADIKTRWKKGQSGNPKGRPRVKGAGMTLTSLARTLLERPVEGQNERITRLVAYMSDIVQLADAGDLNCRIFLLREVGRGDRLKERAQRNAKRAKTEDLRKFEEEKSEEVSPTMESLSQEQEDEHAVAVTPVAPMRPQPVSPALVQAAAERKALRGDAWKYRRDPQTGRLMTPEGRELSWEEEEKLLYPYWPHISPHLPKDTEEKAGYAAGPDKPVQKCQAIDSTKESGNQKNSQESLPDAGRKKTIH